MDITQTEACELLELMGVTTVADINTVGKRKVMSELLARAAVVSTQFMLNDVTPGDIFNPIKIIRVITGWGLKEAKDAYALADPQQQGGRVGPFPLEIPYEKALDAIVEYQKATNWSTNIRVVAV